MAAVRGLSFPLRLTRTGALATVEHDSDAHVEELLAAAVLTRPRERPMVPTFGIADPVFQGWERLRLGLHLVDFGPDVVVEDMEVRWDVPGQENVIMSWRRPESWERRA